MTENELIKNYQQEVIFLSEIEDVRQIENLIAEGISLLGAFDYDYFYQILEFYQKQQDTKDIFNILQQLNFQKQTLKTHNLTMQVKGQIYFQCWTCKNMEHCSFGKNRTIFISKYMEIYANLNEIIKQFENWIFALKNNNFSYNYIDLIEKFDIDIALIIDYAKEYLKIAKQRKKEKLEGKKHAPYMEDTEKSNPIF